MPENRTLADKAYDLFGEMLLLRETDALLAQIEADQARGDTAEMDAFFARQDAKNMKKIRQYFARRRARVFFRKTLPRIGQIVAAVIVVCALAGGVALATSHTLRVQVMQLLVNIETEYTELKLAEDPAAAFEMPAEWVGENYPAYLPDGFTLGSVHSYPDFSSATYLDATAAGRKINFSELGAGTETNLDTEASVLEPVQISGHAGMLATKGQKISAYWDDGRHYFLLITEGLDAATFLRIANSVVRVR